MNSQNINADYLKIANELFDKVNKPQKMTTMETAETAAVGMATITKTARLASLSAALLLFLPC